ncbi:hypothetical protein DRO66_01255 [Candidatus Bathyarchaeota archaeon]|nr:MAG: hypothetical protein DRO66_01255 [Candidatus Bathyarchaeota archaeon]
MFSSLMGPFNLDNLRRRGASQGEASRASLLNQYTRLSPHKAHDITLKRERKIGCWKKPSNHSATSNWL